VEEHRRVRAMGDRAEASVPSAAARARPSLAEVRPVTSPTDPRDYNAGSAPEAALATWMAAAQRGDEAAYRLFLLSTVPILRHAAQRLEDPVAIEEVVQDALRTIHLLRHTYRPARAIRPWVAAIAEARVAAWQRCARPRQNDHTARTRRPWWSAASFMQSAFMTPQRRP